MKKLIGIFIALCMVLSLLTVPAFAEAPADAPEAVEELTEGESAEGESADSEGDSAEDAGEDAAAGDSADAESEGDSSEDAEAGDSADAESSGDSADAESDGESSMDMNSVMPMGQNNEDAAVVVIMDGEAKTQEEFGTLEIAEGGEISAANISGIRLIGTTEDTNGIFIKADAKDQVITIGGVEDYYDVEGIGSFNSVIDVYGRTEEDPETESTYGTVFTINGGTTIIDNVYGHTVGYRAGALYTMSGSYSPTVIVKDSVLWDDGGAESWMHDRFPGSARATLLQATNLWLYNSGIVTRDWGAISQDGFGFEGVTGVYAVNSVSEAYKGGYTLFSHDGNSNYLYGCRMVGAEFGLFMFCANILTLDNIAAASEDALQYADGVDFSNTVTEDGNTLVAGAINAIMVNTMGPGYDPATLNVANTTLSTEAEDITSVYGTELFYDLNGILSDPESSAHPFFYLANVKGAVIAPRSHAVNVTLGEGTVIKSSTGVLMQTNLEYGSGSYHDSTDTNIEDPYVLTINAPITGDVLHQDYQRDFNIIVNSEYTGRTETGSITAWNNLWTRENMEALLEANGMTGSYDLTDEVIADVRASLVREEDTSAYTEVFGIYMTVEADGVWNVQGESSVIGLTVADGATVNASEIYVDCAFGEDGYLDAATGTAVEALEAGEYSNVVLIGLS